MTFSIVARDAKTGALGVATATAGPMVGALVPHGRKGSGVVATQAMTNPYLARGALTHIDRSGAEVALRDALANDQEAGRRQVILVDARGGVAGWTGGLCTAYAGHLLEEDVAVAGNMLAGQQVLPEMLRAYREAAARDLAERLVAALAAGAAAGGDSRGLGSAALLVYGVEDYPAFDVRIDASIDPLADLERLLQEATSGPYAEFFSQVPKRGRR